MINSELIQEALNWVKINIPNAKREVYIDFQHKYISLSPVYPLEKIDQFMSIYFPDNSNEVSGILQRKKEASEDKKPTIKNSHQQDINKEEVKELHFSPIPTKNMDVKDIIEDIRSGDSPQKFNSNSTILDQDFLNSLVNSPYTHYDQYLCMAFTKVYGIPPRFKYNFQKEGDLCQVRCMILGKNEIILTGEPKITKAKATKKATKQLLKQLIGEENYLKVRSTVKGEKNRKEQIRREHTLLGKKRPDSSENEINFHKEQKFSRPRFDPEKLGIDDKRLITLKGTLNSDPFKVRKLNLIVHSSWLTY